MGTKHTAPVMTEEFVKRAEEKYVRRENAKKKTQLRKQQRKRKKEKHYA